jgi:hypothetical protein
MKQFRNIAVFVTLVVLMLVGCKESWDEHYNVQPETVDKNMWDDIKNNADLSMYVDYMEEYELDSLFLKNNAYTLFIPTNDAFSSFVTSDSVSLGILEYHISNHYIQSGAIGEVQKIQMLSEKFVVFQKQNNVTLFDGIELFFESPLYRNGKYFTLNQIAKIKPNIFEFFAETNPVFEAFILDLDSIILDKEKSRPTGFDDNGNTEYDTVAIIYNEFEDLYFPIREEQRFQSATIVFPLEEDYNNALNVMAQTLGDVYQTYLDIPSDWQNDILMPYLLEHGVFYNSLNDIDFIQTGQPNDTLKLKNILGDSIVIDYQVKDRFECSNGITYNYEEFVVPDTLFNGSVRHELEWFADETGVNKYTWNDELITVSSTQYYAPFQEYISSASNDTLLRVLFGLGYTGDYSLEIKFDNLFPRKYLMVVRSNITLGGIFDVYMNDVLIRTIDFWDFNHGDGIYFFSSVTGDYYFPKNGFCSWDAWAINENDYGNATVRFEYRGPGEISTQGLAIDYIDFIPYDD